MPPRPSLAPSASAEAYLQSLYDQFVADRTGDSPEPSWIEPMQARYVIGRDGTIVYADINADYRQHPDPCEIVPLLREMNRAPG